MSDARTVSALRLVRRFSAPRRRVFEAWTDPHALKRWWTHRDFVADDVEVDLREGGSYRIVFSPRQGAADAVRRHLDTEPSDREHVAITGTYREIVPPERLVFTFIFDAVDSRETLVTVEFRDLGDETEVVVVHDDCPDESVRAFFGWGWESVLDELSRAL